MNYEISKIVSILDKKITKSENHHLKRMLHGRGRTYPDLHFLNIDFFSPALFVTLYDERDEEWKKELSGSLLEYDAVESVVFQTRTSSPWQNDIYGYELPERHIITEDGLQYLVNLKRGENPGIFPDMADGRALVRAVSKDKKVLNLFSYTCAFSVAALAGGADSVLNMDMNANSLSRGRESHRLNDHDLARVGFLSHNILKSFGKIKRQGPYDLVIIDPPPSQGTSFNLERDYGKILRKVPEFLSADGEILACLNSPKHSFQWFEGFIGENLGEYEILKKMDAGDDFPEEESGRGLKIIYLKPLSAQVLRVSG